MTARWQILLFLGLFVLLIAVNFELHLLGHVAALFGRNVEGQVAVEYIFCPEHARCRVR